MIWRPPGLWALTAASIVVIGSLLGKTGGKIALSADVIARTAQKRSIGSAAKGVVSLTADSVWKKPMIQPAAYASLKDETSPT